MTDFSISQKDIDSARARAEKKLSTLTSEQVKLLRKKCKLDLFFLSYGVLGYNRLSTNLHGGVCTWMEESRLTHRFQLLLLPRGHYKSTIYTIADSIRMALPYDDNIILPWPENLGTNIRICIGHETAEMASKFLTSITGHFTSNPLLMGLFPECVPSLRKHRINNRELELPRDIIEKESTFDTIGVGGKSQGRHYNALKLDDLIGDKARDSKAEMQAAKDWVDNIQAFFSSFTEDVIHFTGTRWGFGDLYEHIMTSYGPALSKYIRAAEEPDAEGVLRPIFPEAFTTESFEIIKRNPKIWASQYANNPSSVATEFDQKWRRFYEYLSPFRLALFTGKGREIIDIFNLNRIVLVDPAVSGLSGVCVTGTDTADRTFVLKAVKEAWRPPELVEFIFQMVAMYKPETVAIEEVLFSELFRHWLEREMQTRGVFFHITPVKTGGKKKIARIRGLSNFFAGGKIFMHGGQTDLLNEYERVGADVDEENLHLLDALAYGPQLWNSGFTMKEMHEMEQAAQQVIGMRDKYTAY